MFKSLFGKNARGAEELSVQTASLRYVGDPAGNGVEPARYELAKRLAAHPQVDNAWLARVEHSAEAQVRLALILQAPSLPAQERGAVAAGCAGVLALDIMFLEGLPQAFRTQLQAGSRPLYVEGCQLFHCPVLLDVNRSNHLPAEWSAAVCTLYVADLDPERALLRAARHVSEQGLGYAGVQDNRISQLEIERWWDGHVLLNWAAQQEHFPTQQEIHSLVRCAGLFQGPTLGWNDSGGSRP